MIVLDLWEYKTTLVELAIPDAEFVERRLAPKFKLQRPAFGPGYLLNPQQHVGLVTLPSGVLLRCNSKVPIGNLVRMLATALDLPELLEGEVELQRVDELVELTVAFFARSVLGLLEQGIYRAYVDQSDNLPTVRGRIDFASDIRANHVLRHRTFCRYSELTWDVAENQVIRQVVRLLSAQPRLSKDLRNALRSIDTSMSDVSIGRFGAFDLDRFQYHRFNQPYRGIHKLCRLFLESSSLDESLGAFGGPTFLVDMNSLFERFVTRVFEEKVGPPLRVRPQLSMHLDLEKGIAIRPDILFYRNRSVLLVADCKYKPAVDAFRTTDAYQVLSYCIATDCANGVIISPVSEVPVGVTATIRGRTTVTLRQTTIDLAVPSVDWPTMLNRLVVAVIGEAATAEPVAAKQSMSPERSELLRF